MTSDAEGFEQARRVATLLIGAAECAKADFATIVGELDLPPNLARAVVALDEPTPMRDLADRLLCDRSYVTGIADGLEQRGLVERVPGVDRRIKLLSLTPRGRDVRARVMAGVAGGSVLLTRLSPEQRAALEPLLEALVQGARTPLPDTGPPLAPRAPGGAPAGVAVS